MRFTSLLLPLAALVGACSGSGSSSGGPYPYEVMLLATHGGQPWASPLGMSDAGDTVGYAGPAAYDPACLAIRAGPSGVLQELPGVTEPPAFAYAINGVGLVCGEAGRRACVWEGSMLHELQPPAAVFSGSAHGATDAGLVVGSFGDFDVIGPHHCYWPDRDSEAVLLPALVPGDHRGTAWAVNEAGQIAGTSGFEVAFFAVRWDGVDAQPMKIGPLPGALNSEARAINGNGDVVGRSSFADGRTQAFRHERATDELTALPFLPGGGTYAEAFGINDDGDVVGTASAASGQMHAVLWRAGAIHDLNGLAELPPGVAYLSSAVAINEVGRIAAEAVMQDGRRRIAILLPLVLDEGFESGLDGWDPGFDLPMDPNHPGETVAWEVGTTQEHAAEGLHSVRLVVDGSQDDGTIWIARVFDAEPATNYEVRLTFQLWSEAESMNLTAAVAAYAGSLPPEAEPDFDLTQPANLSAGWRPYSYVFDVQSDAVGRVWVAVGISVLWETEIEHGIDDLRVQLLGPD